MAKTTFKHLFKLKYTLPRRTVLIIEISGLVFILLLWYLFTYQFVRPRIEFSARFGEAPYTFEWTGPDGYSETIKSDDRTDKFVLKHLDLGEYKVTLTDGNNKTVAATIILSKEKQKVSVEKVRLDSLLGVNAMALVRNPLVNRGTLPKPYRVIASLKELHFQDYVVRNALYSVKLNVFGYIEAIAVSLILGFIIGLIPFFRSLLSRWIDAIRFVPLAAVTGIFIAWFGIDLNMKVQFLAFGIIVFLLPVVVQRIDEVEKVYRQTAYTLGASKWQIVRHVFWPHVTSKIIDDIRVLTAISWTYIIVAEMVNAENGLGALIHRAQRYSRLDKVFALLIIIVLIGIIQDLIFKWIDRGIFPHKYIKSKK